MKDAEHTESTINVANDCSVIWNGWEQENSSCNDNKNTMKETILN